MFERDIKMIAYFTCIRYIPKKRKTYYSVLRRTLFLLRFLGAPTGLWHLKSPHSTARSRLSLIGACIMLFASNLGAVGDAYLTIKDIFYMGQNRTFIENSTMVFLLLLNITGAVGLDILWWRRKQLIHLLDLIDWETRECGDGGQGLATECKFDCKHLRRNMIQLFAFNMIFSVFVSYLFITSSERPDYPTRHSYIHDLALALYGIRFFTIAAFTLIFELLVTFSWIFRLKVYKELRRVKKNLLTEAKSGQNPDPSEAKRMERWFTTFIVEFKLFDLIFKQISGFIYGLMVWSTLSLSEELITTIITHKVEKNELSHAINELFTLLVLIVFLHSLSGVEHIQRQLVKHLYHLGGPWTTWSLIAFYVYFVKDLGPKLMKNVEPFGLRHLMLFYNFAMILVNGWFFYQIVVVFNFGLDLNLFNFEKPDSRDTSPKTLAIIRLSYLFFISKLVDLIETIFFVLRKKHNQISNLHVYHHSVVPLMTHLSIKICPLGGPGTMFPLLNCLVHIVMYTYYLLSSLGPSVQKYLWWKRYITQIQLIQFVIFSIYSIFFFVYQRGYPPIFHYIGLCQIRVYKYHYIVK
ncbi:unnamed protein product [Medioppia subpectinata]|uniref:Elongation of very long chain fatty acids protein n=1 Tax=Medioppia subpectinata TaxID=1979941 RepID=A0A7R9KN11_9ACAR|nr:unnamed protein product [Medioppia subpectinata]CAG2105410.1 unnamed protein product [Medioppia subpectinata]